MWEESFRGVSVALRFRCARLYKIGLEAREECQCDGI